MNRSMSASANFDVVIVGAGIAGASLAWRLAPHGRVALIERESQPGTHSTGRSAAMFMATYGPPAVRALTRASEAFYQNPPEGFTNAPLLTPRGALYVAAPGQGDLLEQTRAELAVNCPGLQVLDVAAALAKAPCLHPDKVLGALYDGGGYDIDVDALLQGFLKGFRQRGGTAKTNAELLSVEQPEAKPLQPSATVQAPRWTLRLAGGETLQATWLVNAAGAWADEVARLCGAAPVGLQPKRRSAFTFAPPPGMGIHGWPAVVGIDESWYFKPDAGQLLGSPANADPVPPHDVVPEELDIALGIDRIQAATTLTIRRPASTWAGLRSFVADGEPVIGADDACPGFFWLAGQGGYGIQSAAGASQLAASLILGEPLPAELAREGVDPAAVSPRRLR